MQARGSQVAEELEQSCLLALSLRFLLLLLYNNLSGSRGQMSYVYHHVADYLLARVLSNRRGRFLDFSQLILEISLKS